MPQGRFSPAQINFQALADLPNQYAEGKQWRQFEDLKSQGIPTGPNGEIDYNAAAKAMWGADPVAATKMLSAQAGGGAGGAAVYGTPIYGTDAQGNTVLGAIGKDGSFHRLDTGGVTPTPGVQFLNQGTQHIPMNKQTGAPAGAPIPIDVAGEKSQMIQGESEGKAQVNMPLVENATRRIISTIEDIEKSPGLDRATGPIQSRLPTVSGDVADVEAKIGQATSGAFLQMYDQLRGGGAITEAEGAKASGALGRVGALTQSDPGYRQALEEAKFEVFELANVARRKAGMAPQPNPYAPKEVKPQDGGQWNDLGNGVRIRQLN